MMADERGIFNSPLYIPVSFSFYSSWWTSFELSAMMHEGIINIFIPFRIKNIVYWTDV